MKTKYNKINAVLLAFIIVFSISLTSCQTASSHEDFLDALDPENTTDSTDADSTADNTESSDEIAFEKSEETNTSDSILDNVTQNDSTGTVTISDNDIEDTADISESSDETDQAETEPSEPEEIDTSDIPSGDIIQNITNNTITITGNKTNSVTYATAKGLRSAVSIYCTFEITSGSFRPVTQTYYSTGSGVIYEINADGSAFIVTNHHVVYESSSNSTDGIGEDIYVYLYGLEHEKYAISATYVGGSANYDLAVLRVDANEVLKEAYGSGAAAAVSIANSDEIYPGQTTIAIGNPSADELSGISVTSGIVSVDSEYISMTSNTGSGEVSFRVIRTDAAVNSGNSGGGMYNDRGELIGIVNAKISSSDIENIGYALPSNIVRAIADNIIHYCYGTDCESVMRGLLGITVEVSDYDTYFAPQSGLMIRLEEITVHEVTAGGLGEAILKAGDVIKSITIGDKTITVTRQHHLIDAMLDVRVGYTVSLAVIRDGTEVTVSTVITEESLSAY